ncbi:hypothetical protein T439DRAFT_203191 [Meredithblackwellia eburnea MCA 4105]
MLLKPTLSSAVIALALTSNVLAHAHDYQATVGHVHRGRSIADHEADYHYRRGLLDGLLGVVNGLTNSLGLTSATDPQANIISSLLYTVQNTLSGVLGVVSDLPKITLVSLGNTTGIIEVSGPTVGYLGAPSATLNGISNTYGVVADKKDAIQVTIPAISCLTLPNQFVMYAPFSGQPQGTPFISAVSFIDNVNTLSPGGGFGFLMGSNYTSANTFASGAVPYPGFGGDVLLASSRLPGRPFKELPPLSLSWNISLVQASSSSLAMSPTTTLSTRALPTITPLVSLSPSNSPRSTRKTSSPGESL